MGIFGNHYYNRTIRRMVAVFGAVFNDIQLVKYTQDGTTELERITVPLVYAGKEKYVMRNLMDPTLTKSIQTVLPRASFEFTGLQYDSSRKQTRVNSLKAVDGAGGYRQQYQSVPYNMTFAMSFYVRNIEDGAQIIEQIVPMFNPDYTLLVNEDDNMGISRDIPITLDNIQMDLTYEGKADEMRMIIWDLSFTMKTDIFGPVSTAAVIKQANTYIYDSSAKTDSWHSNLTAIIVQSGGFGNFKPGEIVFQGNSLAEANVSATVLEWDATIKKLYVQDITSAYPLKQFTANTSIIGSQSGADWKANTAYIPSRAAALSVIVPNPLSANGYGDFGYTVSVYEAPGITSGNK